MAVYPVLSGRVSDNMQMNHLLSSLRRCQVRAAEVQMQLADGKRIRSISEDSAAAAEMLRLRDQLARLDSHEANAGYAASMLASADAALGEMTDLLRQAHTLGSEAVGAGDNERRGIATALAAVVQQAIRLANRSYEGRYLFSGGAGQEPVTAGAEGIDFNGSPADTRLLLDDDWTMSVGLSAAGLFGAQSGQANAGGDLAPTMAGSTRLDDLAGAVGLGVSLGIIHVSDGINHADIDLAGAATVSDVVDLFNASCPAGMTMSVVGGALRIAGAGPVSVSEVGGGTAARDLGILAASQPSPFSGADPQPRLTEHTLLSSLHGGTGIDKAGGLTVVSGSNSITIDISAAVTVGDVLNAINASGAGAKASIAADGRSLHVVNVRSGADMRIAESSGTTAADLGLRTFHGGVTLASLNGGRGLSQVDGDDIRIRQRDGSSIDIDIGSASTIDEVIDLINSDSDNTGDLTASIGPSGGLVLTDGSVDGGYTLTVSDLNGSLAARQLGLAGTAAGAQLVGQDVSAARPEGIFFHLAGLAEAAEANDTAAIEFHAAALERLTEDVVKARGQIGAQAADVQLHTDRLAERKLAYKSLLSDVGDVDLTEAAVRFEQLAVQLQAGLATSARLLNLSLLNFLQ